MYRYYLCRGKGPRKGVGDIGVDNRPHKKFLGVHVHVSLQKVDTYLRKIPKICI